jgi:enterochelin esterase-like enzyme
MWLADGRRITVYVPELPRTRRRALPLLILHDGQNLFEPERAFCGQTWRVGETADALIAARRIPPLIICGLDHAGTGRIRELTPTPGPKREGGGGRAHADLVVNTLLPLLRREYPVSTEPSMTGLGGSSLGGLATVYTAIRHPGVFGALLVMSPSVWWDRRVILTRLRQRPRALDGTRIWLDVGRREGVRTAADARRLAAALARRGTRADRALALEYVEDPDGEHAERSWAARLPRALEFLFGQ